MAKKEYIERDSIYHRVKRHTNPYGKPTLDYESGVKVLDMIKQEPAADVVEVCRCKDCKHWDEKYKCCIMMGLTALGDSYFYENSFCSRGERKEATP